MASAITEINIFNITGLIPTDPLASAMDSSFATPLIERTIKGLEGPFLAPSQKQKMYPLKCWLQCLFDRSYQSNSI